jgi:hypothetical protein
MKLSDIPRIILGAALLLAVGWGICVLTFAC